MSSRTSRAIVALILSSTLLIAACGGDDLIDEPTVSLPSEIPTELVITDITEGEGEAAIEGSTVYVYYVGVLS